MLPDPQDTIVALASAHGPAPRGIVRLSGKRALEVLGQLGMAAEGGRRVLDGTLRIDGLWAPLPCNVHVFPKPASYTGEDVVEIHTLGSPPLLDQLLAACLRSGARLAQPGEFTLRAFRNGKLDLTRVEAIAAVINAESRDELRQALGQLAGGLAHPLSRLRDDLLNLLADVEAALDFADEDLPPQSQQQILQRVTAALAHVTLLKKQIDQRALAQRPFRVVLAGAPNAGKSSLFNALLGRSAALVSPQAGTTRDYLEGVLEVNGVRICLIDTAGLDDSPCSSKAATSIDAIAQSLGRREQSQADVILWCRETQPPHAANGKPGAPSKKSTRSALSSATGEKEESQREPHEANVIPVWTKADLGSPPAPGLATSVITGHGLADLKKTLADLAGQRPAVGLAPSVTRCRRHVESCLACLRRAHAIVLEEDPPELLALELRSALEEVGAMAGAVFTDDLLDRIFTRFCIGK